MKWVCEFPLVQGVAYKYVEINPYQCDPKEPGGYTKKSHPLETKRRMYPGFVETSPRGLVPGVDHKGKKVWESLPVVEYIDEAFEGPPLLPSSPHDRALVRIWTSHVGDRMQKSFYTMLLEQDPAKQEEARQRFFTECRTFARAMRNSGPFFLGEQFSMVDIALAPFFQRFLWVGSKYRDLVFPEEPEFARLQEWWSATHSRPSVAATMVCRARLVSSYSQYSRNVATSDYAKSIQSSLSTSASSKHSESGGAVRSACKCTRVALGAVAAVLVVFIAGVRIGQQMKVRG